jgi:competence protein ComEA
MKTFLAILAAAMPVAALAAVNVNTAQQSELERTKGLDKVKAKAIIEWRAANGPIDNFTELQQVPGFTPALVDKLKGEIAFSGDPWTPPPKAAKTPSKKSPPTNLASASPSSRSRQ